MKSIFSRSLFTAFLVVAGYVSSLAQTTVTLPTIPCSNCNGPGAFATSAPACVSGLVGAPLTMSWGAATGATSYTIMIATDAALSQNVATYTTTGTSVSVPAVGLAPSTTYYWTVFANSAAGSTKATGSTCSFSTNTTWKGGSATGGFPNGSLSQQILSNGIAGGYYDCRSGDGTCASGDNLLCNPKFQTTSASSNFTPGWVYYISSQIWEKGNGVNLATVSGIGVPSTGTSTGAQFGPNGAYNAFAMVQQLYGQNLSASTKSYQISFWARAVYSPSSIEAGFVPTTNGYWAATDWGTTTPNVSTTVSTSSWTNYVLTINVPSSTSYSAFYFSYTANNLSWPIYFTDAVLCEL